MSGFFNYLFGDNAPSEEDKKKAEEAIEMEYQRRRERERQLAEYEKMDAVTKYYEPEFRKRRREEEERNYQLESELRKFREQNERLEKEKPLKEKIRMEKEKYEKETLEELIIEKKCIVKKVNSPNAGQFCGLVTQNRSVQLRKVPGFENEVPCCIDCWKRIKKEKKKEEELELQFSSPKSKKPRLNDFVVEDDGNNTDNDDGDYGVPAAKPSDRQLMRRLQNLRTPNDIPN